MKFVSIVKKELMYIPFLGWVFNYLDYISVNRGEKDSRKRSRERIVQHLTEKGNSVQVFPEGTRNLTDLRFSKREISFRRGIFEIAVEYNVPIVLIYHTIGRCVRDGECVLDTDRIPYGIGSQRIFNRNKNNNNNNNLNLEKVVDALYEEVYNEFIALEKKVDLAEAEEYDQDLNYYYFYLKW